MAQTVVLLGVSYSVPETTDANFDVQLTAYLKALASAFPQLNGGVQSLTAELDFGVSFGVKAAWFKSETVNPASAGQVRLAKTDSIKIRNNANGADLALAIDTGDALTFNGANVTGNPMLYAASTAGQSIPNATFTTIIYGTVTTDSDSAYNSGTGVYTVPTGKGGDYLVIASLQWAATYTATQAGITILRNAAQISQQLDGNPLINNCNVASAVFRFSAGDTIKAQAFQNQGGAEALSVGASGNFLSIKRIPT